MGLHDDELDVTADLVVALLRDTDPALAALPLRPLGASGSTNAIWSLGADLLVRLPRQPGGGAAIRTEARWGPVLAAALPVACPEVVLVGVPGHGNPESWSVVRRLGGEVPVVRRGGGQVPAADLAAVLVALRSTPVPDAARADPALTSYRAGPLADLLDDGREALAACRDLPGLDLDVDAALEVWERLATTPQRAGAAWVHGDLLAENLLVRDGRLSGVLDLGGLSVGHPAVDLVAAWELLDPVGRTALRARLEAEVGTGDDEWAVGAGWALLLAAITLPYYWHTMPRRCADRLVMARAVLDDRG